MTEVHSHPVALMQCRSFLAQHSSFRAVEAEDTAGAAEEIAAQKRYGCAAICSSSAAIQYGMKILEDSIEDNKHNFTRFLVACHPQKADYLRPLEKADKASIVFSLPHEEGSLSKVLTILSFYDITLRRSNHYQLSVMSGNISSMLMLLFNNLTRYRQAIDAITPLVKSIKNIRRV